MEWTACVHYEKSRRYFVARACALIAPVHTVVHRVSCSFETTPNAPKHYATHQNMSVGSKGVDWVCLLRKLPTWLHGTNFRINCTSSHHFAPSFMQLRNDSKCTQTLCNNQNMSLRSIGVDWVRSLQKIRTWLHGTNFCINCTSSHRFEPSFMQLRNDNRWTQTLWNLPKHEFMVQWGGLGAFVAKNPDVTSWHVFLH